MNKSREGYLYYAFQAEVMENSLLNKSIRGKKCVDLYLFLRFHPDVANFQLLPKKHQKEL